MTLQSERPNHSFRPINLALIGLGLIGQRSLCLIWHHPRAIWRNLNAPDTLPQDMLAQECTIVLCFKLSVQINIYTGGDHNMTFSARCYRSGRTCRNPIKRLLWRALTATIDILCGTLRGEAYHCETAWKNHITRQDHSRVTH
jgi:hypothetical protein